MKALNRCSRKDVFNSCTGKVYWPWSTWDPGPSLSLMCCSASLGLVPLTSSQHLSLEPPSVYKFLGCKQISAMLSRSGTETKAEKERIMGAHQWMGLWAGWKRLSVVRVKPWAPGSFHPAIAFWPMPFALVCPVTLRVSWRFIFPKQHRHYHSLLHTCCWYSRLVRAFTHPSLLTPGPSGFRSSSSDHSCPTSPTVPRHEALPEWFPLCVWMGGTCLISVLCPCCVPVQNAFLPSPSPSLMDLKVKGQIWPSCMLLQQLFSVSCLFINILPT